MCLHSVKADGKQMESTADGALDPWSYLISCKRSKEPTGKIWSVIPLTLRFFSIITMDIQVSHSEFPLAWPIGRFRSNRPRKLQWISERKTQFCHSMSQIGQTIFTQYPMVGYSILINILIIFISKQEQNQLELDCKSNRIN